LFKIFLNGSQIYICHSQFTYSVQKINIYIIIFFYKVEIWVIAKTLQPIVRCRVRVTLQPHHNATTSQPHHDHITTMVTLQHQLQADASAEQWFINMDHSAKPACRKRPQILRIGVAGEVIIINVDRTDGDAYRGSFLQTFPMSSASLIWASRLVKSAFKRSRLSRLPRDGKTGVAEFRHGQLVSNRSIYIYKEDCLGLSVSICLNAFAKF